MVFCRVKTIEEKQKWLGGQSMTTRYGSSEILAHQVRIVLLDGLTDGKWLEKMDGIYLLLVGAYAILKVFRSAIRK